MSDVTQILSPQDELADAIQSLRDADPDAPELKALERVLQSLAAQPADAVADLREKANNFHSRLNRAPHPSWVKKDAPTGIPYLPISHVEAQLDKWFFGQWWEENLQVGHIANEIWVSIDLVALHPVTRLPIRRCGVAATPIQQLKDSNITDGMAAKIKNAIQKNLPSTKAMAVKNAARSLGKIFGRDLGRKHEDTFTPIGGEAKQLN